MPVESLVFVVLFFVALKPLVVGVQLVGTIVLAVSVGIIVRVQTVATVII